MENITTELSNIINYNKSNNSIILRKQTDTQADIFTYRAAFAAKNAKHNCKRMQNITTECSNIIYYNNSNINGKLTKA